MMFEAMKKDPYTFVSKEELNNFYETKVYHCTYFYKRKEIPFQIHIKKVEDNLYINLKGEIIDQEMFVRSQNLLKEIKNELPNHPSYRLEFVTTKKDDIELDFSSFEYWRSKIEQKKTKKIQKLIGFIAIVSAFFYQLFLLLSADFFADKTNIENNNVEAFLFLFLYILFTLSTVKFFLKVLFGFLEKIEEVLAKKINEKIQKKYQIIK